MIENFKPNYTRIDTQKLGSIDKEMKSLVWHHLIDIRVRYLNLFDGFDEMLNSIEDAIRNSINYKDMSRYFVAYGTYAKHYKFMNANNNVYVFKAGQQ